MSAILARVPSHPHGEEGHAMAAVVCNRRDMYSALEGSSHPHPSANLSMLADILMSDTSFSPSPSPSVEAESSRNLDPPPSPHVPSSGPTSPRDEDFQDGSNSDSDASTNSERAPRGNSRPAKSRKKAVSLMPYRDGAERILREAKVPLPAAEIYRRGVQSGIFAKSHSKTPVNSVSSVLYSACRNPADPFVQVGPATFALKEWSDEIKNLKSSRSKKRRVKKELEDRAFDESGVEEFVEAPPPRKRRHFVAPSSSSSTTPTTPSTSSEKLMHMDHSLLESFLLREMQMSLC